MIILKDINKSLGNKDILKDITFHIAPNESVGIVGLNGAGKTTLLNVIAGLIKPDNGFIRVGKVEDTLSSKNTLRNMMYLSGTKTHLWEDIKVKDSFDNCISMYNMDRRNIDIRYKELVELFEIKDFLNVLPRELSLGEKIRCEIVYSLLAKPKIFMLDEMMIGLDATSKYKAMAYFEKYRKEENVTFIYTSHNLMEVEKLCDRIILIDEGKIIFDGSIDKIMKEYAPFYCIRVNGNNSMIDFEDLPIEKVIIDKNWMDIIFDKSKINTAQIIAHIMANTHIEDIKIFEPDLEGTIKNIYKKRIIKLK